MLTNITQHRPVPQLESDPFGAPAAGRTARSPVARLPALGQQNVVRLDLPVVVVVVSKKYTNHVVLVLAADVVQAGVERAAADVGLVERAARFEVVLQQQRLLDGRVQVHQHLDVLPEFGDLGHLLVEPVSHLQRRPAVAHGLLAVRAARVQHEDGGHHVLVLLDHDLLVGRVVGHAVRHRQVVFPVQFDDLLGR